MRWLREVLQTAAAVTCGLAFTAGAANADVRLHDVGPRFDGPVHVAGAPGDGERLYVVEQRGVVKVLRGGVATVFADLTGVVQAGGEEGLLSIAFPPDFQSSRLFYVYFTNRDGDNEVDELRAPTGDAADLASRRTVLDLPHPGAGNHNGGQLQFGPDGMLYLAPGDGARSSNAPSLASPLGKLLRIDPRGGVVGSYTIPADNPFVGTAGARGEIWAVGLRNPYRFSFDRATGDLVLGDVGQGTTEEIDWVPAAAGGAKGGDFGWPTCEGSFAQGSRTTPCSRAGSILPIRNRFRDEGYQSIIPGYVVRDPTLPSLFGRLVYGDYFAADLRSVVPGAGAAASDLPVGVNVPSLTSFGEDAGGCVYATSGGGGKVYRLVEGDMRVPCLPAAPPAGPVAPPVGDGGGVTPPPATAPPVASRPAAVRPAGRLGALRAQRVLRRGGVVVGVRCRVACRLSATATVRSGGRTVALRRASGSARAGQVARLAVRLTPRSRAVVRRALRAGRRPVITLRVVVRPRAGGRATTLRATLRAKR